MQKKKQSWKRGVGMFTILLLLSMLHLSLSPSLVNKIDGLLNKKYYIFGKNTISQRKGGLPRTYFVPKTNKREKATTDKCKNLYAGWHKYRLNWTHQQCFYISKLTSISSLPTSSISTRLHCYHGMVGRGVFFLWVLAFGRPAPRGPDINRMTQSRYSNC